MLSNLSSIVNNRSYVNITEPIIPSSAVLRYTFYSSGTTVPNMLVGGATYNATLTGIGMTTSNTIYPPNNTYSLVCPENAANSTKYLAIPPITVSDRLIFSVCHWIKKGQDTSNSDSIIWELSKNGGCMLYQHRTTKKYYVNGIDASGFTIDTNWHHIAIIYNFSTLRYSLYLDGSAVVTNGIGLNISNAPASNTFGASRIARSISSAHLSFKGNIGDFRIYSGTLTADEVLSIYNGDSI